MKNRSLTALIAIVALAFAIVPSAIASDLTDIGYLDQAQIGSMPQFVAANQRLAAYRAQLDGQFTAAMKSAKSDADRQNIEMQFQQRFSDKQKELVGPFFTRAQLAIAQVMAKKNLSVVVDKRIVVYGGVDITGDVQGLIKSGQAIAPPTATPPPSEIGFVDNTALDASPKIKQANDALAAFAQDQRKIFAAKMTQAKTDADKQQVAADFNKTLGDKRDQLLKPLADQVKSVTASVAQQKKLLLVVDRADIVFGGTDITKDVQNALGK